MNSTNVLVPESVHDPRVEPVANEVNSLTTRVASFEVASAESYESGAELLKTIKSLSKQVDDQRKKITQPLDQAKKQVMDLFRPFTDSLGSAESSLKRRMIAWKSEQDRIAREAERKAEEKARRERERLEAEAAKAEEKGRSGRADILRDRAASTVAAPVIRSEAPKVTGIATRKVWRFRIVDAAKVPDQYKVIDEKKIGGVVRALKGDTSIPGVEVWEEDSMAARSA